MDKSYYKDQIKMDGHLNSLTYKLIDDNSDQQLFRNVINWLTKIRKTLQKNLAI